MVIVIYDFIVCIKLNIVNFNLSFFFIIEGRGFFIYFGCFDVKVMFFLCEREAF